MISEVTLKPKNRLRGYSNTLSSLHPYLHSKFTHTKFLVIQLVLSLYFFFFFHFNVLRQLKSKGWSIHTRERSDQDYQSILADAAASRFTNFKA
ncbi:hypothetical protein NC653_022663 [Populus alba x Populus x berolinensis]|uniref:Uncharacterized protein n=1 Tax=Populus alba x Populus x berolinensis TaxID=444605 RepID=A0AAD6QBX5_9ROSI|nr:hypothetical protein NC653_022663 [Populus alba x Populus x berolinensis]